MKRHITRILALLIAIPCAACANPGTQLVVGGYESLLLITVLIGICEGLIIAKLLRIRASTSIWVMILANFLSWLSGVFLLAPSRLESLAKTTTLYNLHERLTALALESFVLAVVIEWPFCYGLAVFLKSKRRPLLTATIGVAVFAQLVSYTGLLAFLSHANHWSTLTGVRATHDLSFARKTPATVYFLGEDGVYRVSIDGTGLTKVLDQKGLPLWESSAGELSWEVDTKAECISLELLAIGYKEYLLLCKHFTDLPQGWQTMTWHEQLPLDLRQRDARRIWEFRPIDSSLTFWKGGKKLKLWVRAPLANWSAHYGTIIPGDLVVYQLEDEVGDGSKIIALGLREHRVGVLAEGRSPMITLGDIKEIDNDIRRNVERIRREAAAGKDP